MTFMNTLSKVTDSKSRENELALWNSNADAIMLPFTDEEMVFSRSAEFDSQVILLTESNEGYANAHSFLSK